MSARALALIAIIFGSAAIVTSLAAPANADFTFYPTGSKGDGSFYNYWHDLNAYGVSSDLPTASALGTTICTKLRDGAATEDALVATGGQGHGYTRPQAQVAVFGAEWHFCPEYY